MSKSDDGGPAFPSQMDSYAEAGHTQFAERGMSMRDYFAAKAMQSFYAHALLAAFKDDSDLDCDLVSKIAYTMADSMIAWRAK